MNTSSKDTQPGGEGRTWKPPVLYYLLCWFSVSFYTALQKVSWKRHTMCLRYHSLSEGTTRTNQQKWYVGNIGPHEIHLFSTLSPQVLFLNVILPPGGLPTAVCTLEEKQLRVLKNRRTDPLRRVYQSRGCFLLAGDQGQAGETCTISSNTGGREAKASQSVHVAGNSNPESEFYKPGLIPSEL